MKKLFYAAIIPLSLILCFWLLKIAETVYGIDLYFLGIYPREVNGLQGIIIAPFIHGSFEHLIANTIPFLVLGTVLFYFYRGISLKIFIFIWLFSGVFVWLTGRPAWHIGASGVAHGLFAFLFISGLIRKSKELIAISLLAVFLYGSMIWGFIPEFFPGKNISFEGHGGGLLTGFVLSILFRNKGPQRKQYQWNEENDEILSQKQGLKIVIDTAIPYVKGVFEPYASVYYIEGDKISSGNIYDADALIIRTRTQCNRKLLENSSVRFIATTTIGYDHIDTEYCRKNNIQWINAPGCNSGSVMQYMASALAMLALEKEMDLSSKTIGIIGVGNVGKKIAALAEIFNMKALLYDPPRALREGAEAFTSLEKIQEEADIITFHIPLQYTSQDATFHFADAYFFRNLKKKPFIINTSRGEVIETHALKYALNAGLISGFILDVFESEPKADRDVINLSYLATPHIAGYSADGKANGTKTAVQAVGRFFNLPLNEWEVVSIPEPEAPLIPAGKYQDFWLLIHCLLHTYNISQDDMKFRANPSQFEMQRNRYPIRREYSAYTVQPQNVSEDIRQKLIRLGFHVVDQTLPQSH